MAVALLSYLPCTVFKQLRAKLITKTITRGKLAVVCKHKKLMSGHRYCLFIVPSVVGLTVRYFSALAP